MAEFTQDERAKLDEWLAALRSGKYKQGQDRLSEWKQDGVQYCCLGVACHINVFQGDTEVDERNYVSEEYTYDWNDDTLLSDDGHGLHKLSRLNDTWGKSFEYIADEIQKMMDVPEYTMNDVLNNSGN